MPFWTCFQTAGVRNCLTQSPSFRAFRRCFFRFFAEAISRSSMTGCVDNYPFMPRNGFFGNSNFLLRFSPA